MLRHKVRDFKMHLAVSLDDLVSVDHFYRRLDAALDLTFVRELVKSWYASTMGSPSIDPIVFFKLHLIMFFEGIRSERQLRETVHLNLAHHWYTGYDLDEPVPDHSSLSKIRDRYGVEVFQQFFEAVVERCIQAGLVWRQELYFDGTKGQANAALTAIVPRLYLEAQDHLTALFLPEETAKSLPVFQKLVDKYDGSRLNQRTTDQKVSLVDPDATPMKRFTRDKAVLGYHTHYIVDGGDTRYGTIPNLAGLEQDGLHAYLPLFDLTERSTFYSSDRFTYLGEKDAYLCPQGAELTLRV